MTLRYEFTGRSRKDLEAILEYSYQTWGPTRTRDYLEGMEYRINWLRDNPGAGRLRPEIADNLKSFPQGSHVIYYRVTEEVLLIVRIRHQSADTISTSDLSP